MKEITVPTSHISQEANVSFIVSEDISCERMRKGDVAFIKYWNGSEAEMKSGHLYVVMLETDRDSGKEPEFKLFRILKLGDNKLGLYMSTSRELIIKSLDEIYIVGEVVGFQSSIVTPQEAIDAQKELNNIAFGDVIDINGTIFKSPNGCILNEGKVNDNIRSICDKAGIERFSSHAFRDTLATRALESGMPPKTLQEILGHSDFGMTMNVYAHVMETTKAKEMELVDIKVK